MDCTGKWQCDQRMEGSNKIKSATIALLMAAVMPNTLSAQDLEYKMEFGAMAGLGFYMGDANLGSLYKDASFAGAAIARYNLNPRMAVKANLGVGRVQGSVNDKEIFIPERVDLNRSFDNMLVDLGAQFEANFFGFGKEGSYKGHKRLTPYIEAGLGFTYCNSTLSVNLPIGFGVKYKLMERVNVGAEWTMRIAMTDRLDGIRDPYRIEGGFLKNKDAYSWTMLYATFDMFPKLRKCNND